MSTIPTTTTEPTVILAATDVQTSASLVLSVQTPADGTVLTPEKLVEALAVPTVTSEHEEQSEIDFRGELNEFVGQIPPINTLPPATAGGQDEQRCAQAKRAILNYYGASIICGYLQGKYLFLLQQERAKPGTGTFVADLTELRKAGALALSTATAYRRISNYEAIREGLVDLLPRRLSQAEKDAWGLEEMTVQGFEEALERNAGDESVEKFAALIEEEKKRLAKLKREQGGLTTMNVQFFGLSAEQKQQFHSAFDLLVKAKGPVSASQFVVEMLCTVTGFSKAVAA
jgi:hypothetical protein